MINDYQIAQVIQRCYGSPTIESFGVECRVECKENEQFIGVRGTTDISDWITNLRFLPMPHFKLGFVHVGFWLGCYWAFSSIIRKLDIEKPVYIGGHSKGGPEAVLLAYMLDRKGYRIARVVTFGAPQFVSDKGAKKLRRRFAVKQYRNEKDPVTNLPTNAIDWLGHVNPLIKLGDRERDDWRKVHLMEFYLSALI